MSKEFETRTFALYLLVGGLLALGYLLVAHWLRTAGSGPVAASVLAFAMMVPAGFFSHRLATFGGRRHAEHAFARFLSSALLGFALCGLIPWLGERFLDDEGGLSFLLTSVAVPVLNFVLLDRWVFRAWGEAPASGGQAQ